MSYEPNRPEDGRSPDLSDNAQKLEAAGSILLDRLSELRRSISLYELAEVFLAPPAGVAALAHSPELIKRACRAHEVKFLGSDATGTLAEKRCLLMINQKYTIWRYRWDSRGLLRELRGFSDNLGTTEPFACINFKYSQGQHLRRVTLTTYRFKVDDAGNWQRSRHNKKKVSRPRLATLKLLGGTVLSEDAAETLQPIFIGPDFSRIDQGRPENTYLTAERIDEINVIRPLLDSMVRRCRRSEDWRQKYAAVIVGAWHNYLGHELNRLYKQQRQDRLECCRLIGSSRFEFESFPSRIRSIVETYPVRLAAEELNKLSRDFRNALPNCPSKEDAAVCRSNLLAARYALVILRVHSQRSERLDD